MKPNYFTQLASTVGRWMMTTLFFISAIAFFWQGIFFSTNIAAMANPAPNLITISDAGNQVKDKVNKDTGRAKNFIDNAKDQVKETANKNADRVDRATDNSSFLERKASKDSGRIEERANQDASRTKKAVDNTKNAIENTVDNIKDAFGN
ncbi:hypothetical protein [Planktothrix sp. FACHB-1365]|uniref:hypothetical protein n=1 Tax=Planktothrix sp. FACHB-1365 TaxID=2692855 RepID=UPI0016824CB7|nr:hypothetical protein [Planktothrix sp. FACHB-1365]MBD2480497.1 hypothetical protein [Planktothrix sp. FACHB-1365]